MHLASHPSTCRGEQDFKTWPMSTCLFRFHPVALVFQTVPPFRISTLSSQWTRFTYPSLLVHADFLHPPPSVAAVDGLEYEVHQSRPNPPPKLRAMPFLPLENVPRLQEWLLAHFSSSTFDTKWYPLPVMTGPPHHIHLSADAVPYACHTPVLIPKHWEAEVQQQLDEDVRKGVIRQVPTGQATEWCARMVVVAKKSGKPRRTVDFQKLNKHCLREIHHTPAPFDMASGVPVHSYKTVADAHWSYHQVELDEESR